MMKRNSKDLFLEELFFIKVAFDNIGTKVYTRCAQGHHNIATNNSENGRQNTEKKRRKRMNTTKVVAR